MRAAVRNSNGSAVLNPIQAEKLHDVIKKLETLDFSSIQKDLGKHEAEANAIDVLICSSNCLGDSS